MRDERASTARISACIVCRNEADRLGPCLESVAGWVDEIVLLDLESSDGSAELACAYGARVVVREPVPVVEMVRNEVAGHATGEWILALDPDERVSPALAVELRRLASWPKLDLIEIPFLHHDFGYAPSSPLLRYDPKPRMYRRDKIVWPTMPNALPHAPPESTYRIPARDDLFIAHDRNRSVEQALDRVIRYAPEQARAMLEAGHTFSARGMFSTLTEKALRQYYYSRAHRDGVPGLIRATTLVAFHFYVWAALWHQSGAPRTPEDDAFVRRLGMVVALGGRAITLAFAARARILRARSRLVRCRRALAPPHDSS